MALLKNFNLVESSVIKRVNLQFKNPLFEEDSGSRDSTQVIVAALDEEQGIGLTITARAFLIIFLPENAYSNTFKRKVENR